MIGHDVPLELWQLLNPAEVQGCSEMLDRMSRHARSAALTTASGHPRSAATNSPPSNPAGPDHQPAGFQKALLH